ncbi:type III effector [Xanthomonas hyacinthi]|uniref:Type III effector n=2 Tax=Xanthomonas hyacinthi TaxID=56455 RepID=A0A2S7ER47_9XANT|nr:type III effector [Xanthomonas hyacinthi DSM 19077]PPU95583.1 type III effector [Xanthomonas hyacinthi]QGY75646.1 type III effector [Xanthomonas hyacinthi]
MVPVNVYQAARSHPKNAIKDRFWSAYPMMDVADADASPPPRSFDIHERTTVKVAGFNYQVRNDATTRHLYSTGTSRPDRLVVTDNMAACIAIACAAERINPGSGKRLPGAKVRVFHILPFGRQDLAPDQVLQSIAHYVKETKEQGLTLRVAMHGGDKTNPSSVDTAKELRELFLEQGIPLEFDETCENRDNVGKTPLGAVIENDHSVRFVTHLRRSS